MSKRQAQVWVGIDAGKGHHWAAVVDESGSTLWSQKIDNDESAILTALGEILDLAEEVHWAVDISGTSSALLLALLAAHGQRAVYVPGRTVNRMSGAYRGEAKTDARDAYVIAETARHRRDFTAVDVPAQLAADLALLTAHRTDLVADRVRLINRLRDVLTGVFPALERAFDYSAHKGALVLLTGYQTPAAIRRRGRARLTAWLAGRGVRSADSVAATALEAAQAQQTALPGEDVAAQIVADLAAQILALDDRLKRLDQQIRETFRTHPQAEIIESLPGMGPILGAEFVVAAGDLAAYADAGHLASAPGWCQSPATPGAGPATCTAPSATAAACAESSTCPRRPASSARAPIGTSTSRSAVRAASTSRLSSPWPVDAPASCGPSCATTERSPPPRRSRKRLDFIIEAP